MKRESVGSEPFYKVRPVTFIQLVLNKTGNTLFI